MRRLIALSLVALTGALAFVIPAQAQFRDTQFRGSLRDDQFCATPNRNNRDDRFRGGWGFGRGNNIDSTQARLQARISRGITDGRLNAREAARLQSRLTEIANLEARMRQSGNRLTMQERQRLQRELQQLNMRISNQLSDFERRRLGYWNNHRYMR